MAFENISLRTPTETISVRLNRDASAVVTRITGSRNLTGPEAASALVMLGYATMIGDPDAVRTLMRHLQTIGEERTTAARLLSVPVPPAIRTPGPDSARPEKKLPPAPAVPKPKALPTANGKPLSSVRKKEAGK